MRIPPPKLPETALGVEMLGMTKHFGPLAALEDVSIKIKPGSVHALLGENGAGKSTLVKCLVGFYRPDNGDIFVNGKAHDIRSPRDAHQLGIGMVYQHFTLAPGMTVAENLLLSRGDLPWSINWRREYESLATFMARMPFKLDLGTEVSELAAGEKQKLEILKQLYLRQRLLILDEPTSVLTPGEADEVLGLLHGLTRQGEISVLMITHKFREVIAYADSVTVLRRGRLAGNGQVGDLDAQQMAELMMGSTIVEAIPATQLRNRTPATHQVRLRVEELKADNDRGSPAVRDINLHVCAGEIVGIAGVSGNGQRELIEVLLGQRVPVAGTIRVEDVPYHATREEIRRGHIFSLPEEPLRNACVPGMSVAENMALRTFDVPPTSQGWRLNRRAMLRRAQDLIEEFNVRPPHAELPIDSLSGGNVQRAVLARELSESVRLLIVANPVFGLDFKATQDIHRRLLEARNAGAAILMVSEDLDELLELADRILVMSEGRVAFETQTERADVAEIGRYMAGAHHPQH